MPWFYFGGPFMDEKSDFKIANFQICWIFAKNTNFSKSFEYLKEGVVLLDSGLLKTPICKGLITFLH